MSKFCIFFLVLLLQGSTMPNVEQKTIYGYVEKVILLEKNVALLAKLDTGAKSASLSAVEIKKVEEDDNDYLTFKVPTKQGLIDFKSPYIGKVKIKLRTGEQLTKGELKKAIKRPLVLMNMQIGNKIRTIRVNLTNRKRFLYPLLLGREAIIAFHGLVDPGKKFNSKEN